MILSDLERQGLKPFVSYSATVVDDNDPRKLGRIKFRIPHYFDGIDDEFLPWAIPNFEHVDGATDISGSFFVPQIGSEVYIQFQPKLNSGEALNPVWSGFHVTEQTQLQEMLTNYPRRSGHRLQNMALIVLDTVDNIAYLRWPGTVKLRIEGNVEIEVMGNVEERVHGNVTREIKGNLTERVLGNKELHVGGTHKEHVVGEHNTQDGNLTVHSDNNIDMYASNSGYFEAISHLGLYTNKGDEDYPQMGSPGSVTVDKEPDITEWKGIRGGSKGSNDRK